MAVPNQNINFEDSNSSISRISFLDDNDESARLDRMQQAEDEEAVIDIIDDDYERLIRENTYPGAIGAFLWLDKNYLLPIFKRPTEL